SNLTGDIENNSSLMFTDGTNSNYIFGTGRTTIDGEVVNSSTIVNNITINEGKQLTTSATDIHGRIENDGTLIFNRGTNNNYIFGNSNLNIEGYVINNSSITQSTVTVASIGTFENNNVLKSTDYINNGIIVNNSTITASGQFYNVGITTNTNYIKTSTYTNKANSLTDNIGIIDADTLNIEKGSTFNTSFDNIIIKSDFENDGEITAKGGTIKNNIFGEGKLIIENTVVNNKDINQSSMTINIGANFTNNKNITIDQTLINNGHLINEGDIETAKLDNVVNSTITNNLNLIVNEQGQNNGRIEGNGNFNINGNFDNLGYFKQNIINISSGTFNNENALSANSINIQDKVKLISNANNIDGNIINNGNLIFNSGIENNNKITGTGNLYVNCNLINNNAIKQKELILNSNIQQASSLNGSSSNSHLSVFTNNSEIEVETLRLKDTIFKLTEKGSLAVDNLTSQNSAMDLANSLTQKHNFKTISVTDKLNLAVDVDLKNKTMDTINADSYSEKGNMNINEINILTELKGKKAEIEFTASEELKDKITSIDTVNSRLFKYNVEYNKNAGTLNFSVTAKDNPEKVAGQIAMAEGLITQTTVLNQAFASMENIKSRILQVKNEIPVDSPIYASRANTIFFQKTGRIESGLWLRPFYSQETINFDNLSVDNTLTGTLAGLDLATGENSLVSLYLGYAGSEQKYENIKVSQTGYILGATGMLLKEQWYAGVTANINFNKAESQSSYGTDNFDMNMYSVGAKAGYNFDLSDKWKLEPNLMLMYGNVNSQEYQTKQGAKVEGQSVANIIFEPQIKAKLNLENGWQPYGLIGYVVNAGDKVTTKVEEVEFDGQKIGNYVEFGAGVDKSFKNSPWSLYIQLMGRSGDRTGFDGNFGMKYSFLTAKEKRKIAKIKKIQEKRKAKQEYLKQRRKMETEE
ncbi:autotransporter domain-containing protein, partial [Candidatus Ruminimicrobium bovinum]|uniref:autotransporter domain-containing protein n=1 Tax=Candidatus Ruminimicrobium bovinum TaxID=3242779 RepID=UPI0039B84E69